MITGNKGEWSEVYTLLKVISDKQLFAGDSNLNKIETLVFPIIKVLRDETNGTFEFSYDNDLVIVNNGEEEIRISVLEFQKQAHFLLTKLKEKTNATFSIPEISVACFLESFSPSQIFKCSLVSRIIKISLNFSSGKSGNKIKIVSSWSIPER